MGFRQKEMGIGAGAVTVATSHLRFCNKPSAIDHLQGLIFIFCVVHDFCNKWDISVTNRSELWGGSRGVLWVCRFLLGCRYGHFTLEFENQADR